MKVERAGSVCSDDAPSSPESVMSVDSSPVASPQPAPESDNYNDQRLYSPAYTPDEAASPVASSPDYSFPPSPLYSNFGSFEFSPTYHPHPFDNSYCDQDHFECQAKFLRAVQESNHKEVKRILAKYSELVQINGFTRDGQTALTQSCLNGNLEVVKLLISHGASVHLTNRDGFSPLHVACFCGKIDVMQYLLRTVSNSR